MRDKRTVRRSLATAPPKTDWSKFDAQSDEAIEVAVRSDPDAAPPLTPAWFEKAKRVQPRRKQLISIRLDEDVLEYFRRQERWQTRVNGILRAVMEHERAADQ
jgi:uncharacterized protein (DUF4415 family)